MSSVPSPKRKRKPRRDPSKRTANDPPKTPDDTEWSDVTEDEPCVVCGHDGWCSREPESGTAVCRRSHSEKVVEGWICTKDQSDTNGDPYTVWVQTEGRDGDRHKAYEKLLNLSPLNSKSREHLRERGLNKSDIRRLGYGYLGNATSRLETIEEIVESLSEVDLKRIPGLYIDEYGALELSGGIGIMIPVRDPDGLICTVSIRHLNKKKGPKYTWLSSKKQGGSSPGSPIHFPLTEGDHQLEFRITEGALKADIATILSGIRTIGLPGVTAGDSLLDDLKLLKPASIRLAFDADLQTNEHVERALIRLYRDLKEHFAVHVETWPPEVGKGIDDVLLAGHTPELLSGAAADEFIEGLEKEFGSPKVTIEIDLNEAKINLHAAIVLSMDPGLYTRSGEIVNILPSEPTPSGIKRPEGLPRIASVPEAIIREKLSESITWLKMNEEGKLVGTRPPSFTTKATLHRGHYPDFRSLEGIATGPTMRCDGTILASKGYDQKTGLFLPEDFKLSIPGKITSKLVKKAKKDLLDLVSDFPFEKLCHVSVWLSFLLTMLARGAYSGLQPLFLFDSNTPGTGKGLLGDMAITIAIGQAPACMQMSSNDEEMRKVITTLVLARDSLVKLDNLDAPLGGQALEAALTSERWKDRILATNRSIDEPLRIVWYATGNNVTVSRDMIRRVARVRLVSPLEHPETRSDFKIKDIGHHCKTQRGKYLTAGLSILKAYFDAGSKNCCTTRR